MRSDAAFEAGKWVLVERKDGTRDFVKCVEVDGAAYLRTPRGDDWRYAADRYRIIAKAYGGFRPM